MKKYIWIGRYESELMDSDYFDGSITIYGSNNRHNYAFSEEHKDDFTYDKFISFAVEKIYTLIKKNNNYRFLLYNELWGYDIIKKHPNLKYYLKLNNEAHLLEFLNNKILSRTWICSKHIKTPPFLIGNKNDCSYDAMKEYFEGYDTFIIQDCISEGGEGTIIIDKNNKVLCDRLSNQKTYIIAPYFYNALSLNVTIFCNKNGYIKFPISEQLFDNNYMFNGSDFISGNEIYLAYKDIINDFIDKTASLLIQNEYIGICGIDFVIDDEKILFIEFNPRFQGSSFLLNYYFKNTKLPLLQEIQLGLYQDNHSCSQLQSLIDCFVPYAWTYTSKSDSLEKIVLSDGKTVASIKYIYSYRISPSRISHLPTNYYNYFATKYKYILPDFENDILTEGPVLKNIFERYAERTVRNVLDCTCGIGVQAISLAKADLNVVGSDISSKELDIARKESEKRNLKIPYFVADCRKLEDTFKQQFDAIISIDSALNHLLCQEDITTALRSIYNRLFTGGIFIASFRDYDEMLKQKPIWAYPTRYHMTSNGSAIILRHLTWNNSICTSNQFYIDIPKDEQPKLFHNTYKQWAITRSELLSISRNVPFSKAFWLSPEESGFYQQIFCAIK